MKEMLRKNKEIIISFIVMCLIGIGIVCILVLTNMDKTKTAEDTATIIDEGTGEKKTVEADSEAAKEAKAEGNVVKENNKAAATKSAEKKATAKKNTTAKKSNNSSSSKGSSSSGTKKPAHTHSWVAQYGTKSVPYTATEYYQVTVCSDCGIERPSGSHCLEHAENGGIGGRKEVTKTRTVTKYKTERYVTGYRCSCGATK